MLRRCLIHASVVLAIGCGSRTRPVAAPAAPPEVEGDDSGFPTKIERSPEPVAASETPSTRLIAEAVRQLRAMKTTHYRHKSKIDEATGKFDYDCSGFVAYALLNAAPTALAVVPIGIKGRPRAEDFASYFSALPTDGPWISVKRGVEIAPGDIVAWLRPADVDNSNTGHIAIVLDKLGVAAPSTAVAKAGGARELLFRVVEATESPQGDDVRGPDTATGLGTGTIGLVVDGSDAPVAYRWKGGESARAHATLISVARLR
jgi:hypothetical protein